MIRQPHTRQSARVNRHQPGKTTQTGLARLMGKAHAPRIKIGPAQGGICKWEKWGVACVFSKSR